MATGEAWRPTVVERWAVMRRYLDFALEHFGDDEKGLGRAHRFVIWHLHFWHRWRPYDEADFRAHLPESLIQKREDEVTGDPEEVLLASADEADHEVIWRRLVDNDFPGA
jgi:tRNA-dihydrouridine synthase 3